MPFINLSIPERDIIPGFRVRVVDAGTRRYPLQRKIGAGIG
jgi:membrane protein YdbS with pleckstrin-like domain